MAVSGGRTAARPYHLENPALASLGQQLPQLEVGEEDLACYQLGGLKWLWPTRARLSQAEPSPATADVMRWQR